MARSSQCIGRGTAAALVVGAVVIAFSIKSASPSWSNFAFGERAEVPKSADTVSLAGLEAQFREIAEQVAPSVVAISVATTPVGSEDIFQSETMTPQRLDAALNTTTRMVGTGFVIDADGYILTNEHVIGEAEQLWVTTDSDEIYPAIVIGSDPRADLAVLKIPAKGLPVVKFSHDKVNRGQWAIALGNPYGLAAEGEMCMSVGVISATDRSLPKLASKENRLYTDLIQTTAEINPGNSGGPLFNLNGEVIGINTAVILPQKSTNGIGFAMPITHELLASVECLMQGQEIVYSYLGVMVSEPTPRQRRANGIAQGIGAVIDSIEPGTPAANSDLKKDDVVVAVDNRSVRDGDHFVRMIGKSPIDQLVKLQIYRGGRKISLDVSPRKRQLPSVVVTRQSQRLRWQGLLLGPIPAHWNAAKSQAAKGLMVLGVSPNSPMLKTGVREGAIITAVAGQPVTSIAELQKLVNVTPAEQCALQIYSDEETLVSAGE